ncbi:MAG: DUF4304 domain-containing protein [Bacteroidetes bacterium]|nr:DUF4304 domain-containing protein [Bacteroidota bacterium]
MDSKDFKKIFGELAKLSGFENAFGGWFKESAESIIILELQKSNFGNYYQLNIKIFIQGIFGRRYLPSKDLVKGSMGHINFNETKDYKNAFDFDEPMDDDMRERQLNTLFENHIVPITNKTLSKSGVKELADKGAVLLLPVIKEELGW